MDDGQDNKTGPEGRPQLTLKRPTGPGASTVKQSFSHGRQRTVVVEVKPSRGGPAGAAKPSPSAPSGGGNAAPRPNPGPRPGSAGSGHSNTGSAGGTAARPANAANATAGRGLSAQEIEARRKALEAARQDADSRREREQKEQAERAAREQTERAALEAARRKEAEDAAARRAEAIAQGELVPDDEPETSTQELPTQAAPKSPRFGPETDDEPHLEVAPLRAPNAPDRNILEELGGRVKPGKKAIAPTLKPVSRTRGEAKRRDGRINVNAALADDDQERQRSLAALKRSREKERSRRMTLGQDQEKVYREVVIPEAITVAELANRMTERLNDVVRYLMKQGQMLRGIDIIDADMAQLIVEEFGHTAKRVSDSDVEEGLTGEPDDPEKMLPRPPVITVMGHVDHGKTSLLDALRKTEVAAGEAGGITQHIGAYQVRMPDGKRLTFLDTPGHAAFSSMRARGAQVTDIVVLVVAADDGVMPQTIEAIKHAKAAEVPMIVAVNKIDRPGADPQKVLAELLQYEVVVEAFGGETQAIEVSATKRLNLDKLLEAIELQAEVLELKANPDRAAEAVVVEAKLDRGRGPVASVLVQRGTLRKGDIVVVGSEWGRVRALFNERSQQVDQAGPSEPVEILGLEGVPDPSDILSVVESEARAREIVSYRQSLKRQRSVTPSVHTSLELMMARMKTNDIRELPLVVKGDVQGSVEAITGAAEKISGEEVRARVIMGGVGGVSEADVQLAKASGAPILAFNVRANVQARDLAEREGVEIRYYSIIYELLDDLRDTLTGMLKPIIRERFIGYAQILEVFNITKVGKVAGCRITEGVVKRGVGVRLLRENVVIHTGKLATLKRFKDEVAEVNVGQECGMAFEKYEDIRPGDQIECFETDVIQRTLDPAR